MKKSKLEQWCDSLQVAATPGMDECLGMLGHHIKWLEQLESVPQDPEWHAEGDVRIHTSMVLDELYALLEGQAAHIQGWMRQALILGALLHDVGKTQRTKELEIKGVIRVASPQHEAVGRSYLTFKLLELPLSFRVVWTVLGLVGEHHMPKRLVVRNQSKGDYIALSFRANLELLYWLEQADMRGRICPDLNKQLSILDEFKMFAEDYDLWKHSYQLYRDIEPIVSGATDSVQQYVYSRALRGMKKNFIYMPEEALAQAYQHKDHYSKLVVLCGPSGSGKSSWVACHCQGYELVSLDEIREQINGCRTSQKNRGEVIHLAKERLKSALRSKKNVVWDATNLRSDFRKIICDFGRDYHALVSLVVFLLPERDIKSGNSAREYCVPDSVLAKQLESYQFPLTEEAHQYCVVGQGGSVLMRSGYFEKEGGLHYPS